MKKEGKSKNILLVSIIIFIFASIATTISVINKSTSTKYVENKENVEEIDAEISTLTQKGEQSLQSNTEISTIATGETVWEIDSEGKKTKGYSDIITAANGSSRIQLQADIEVSELIMVNHNFNEEFTLDM